MANILLEQAFKALEDVQDVEITAKDLYESKEEYNLPKEVVIDAHTMNDLGIDPQETDGDEISEILSDYLSDEYGFCHYGFNFDVEGDHINVYDISWDTTESLDKYITEEDDLKESCSDKELIDKLVAFGTCDTEEEAERRVARMSQEMKDEMCKSLSAQAKDHLLNDSLKEEIKVYCYSKEPQVFKTRKEAIDFFKDAERNSEGSEQERYTNVLFDLEDGLNICWDQVTPLSGEVDKAYNAQLKESKHVCEKCGKRVCECDKKLNEEPANTSTTISVLDDGEKVIKQVGYSALCKKVVNGKPVYTVKYAPGYVVNTIEAKHDREAISRFLGLNECLKEEVERDYFVVSYGNPYKAIIFNADEKEKALELAKSQNSHEDKEGEWKVYHYTQPVGGELNYEIISESCNESKKGSELAIKYWVDEEHRDQGLSDIYIGEIEDLEDAKHIADRLFDEYASVEVVKNVDTDHEEVLYGRYPEDESLKESKECFFEIVFKEKGDEEEKTERYEDDFDGARADFLHMTQDDKDNYQYVVLRKVCTDYKSGEDIEVIDSYGLNESLKESHNPSFSELEEWCMNNPVEMIKTIRRIRSGEMTDGDREVFNDFGFDSYSEEELKNKLDELENSTNSWIYDSGDFSEEEIAKIEKELEESLKEEKETVELEDGTEIDVFDTYEEAYKHLEQVGKNFEHYEIVEDSYEVPNGLLLIAYEKTDDDEIQSDEDGYWVETGDQCLVAYKKGLNEALTKDEKSVSEEHKEDDKVVCAKCGSEEVKFNDPETKEPLCDKCYQKKVEKQKEEEKKSLDESITVNINDEDEVKKAKKEIEKSEKKADEEEIIVDVDAETIDDLKDSYVGNCILSCTACKTLMYKKPELVEKDEETGLYNVGESCPHCGAESGFELVGQVAKADVDVEQEDLTTTGAPVEQEEEKVEVKDEIKLPTEMKSEESNTKLEKLDLNEQRFDRLVNKFVHSTYENVENYETKNLYLDDNNMLIVEGVIKYKSGKEKEASFKLEEKKLSTTKEDVIALKGICEAFNTNEKAFTFRGVIKENKLNLNSLTYNFNINTLNESKNIKGKVCIKY